MTDINSTTDKNFVSKSDTASIVSSQDSDSESSLNKALSFKIKDSKLIPSLILIGGILALSSTAIFIKVSIREISSEATVFNRMLFSTLIFTSWYGRKLFQSSSDNQNKQSASQDLESDSTDMGETPLALGLSRDTWVIVGLVFAMSITQLAARLVWTWSLDYTTAANGTMLANMPPLFTALGGWLFLGQRFDRRFLTGLAIAMLGAVVLGLGDWLYPDESLFGTMTVVGDSAALLSSAFYAVGYLIIEKLRQHLSTSDILVWRCVCGLVMVTPLVLLVDDVIFPISTTGWLAILGLAFVSEVIGHGSVVYVLKHFSSAFVTMAFLMEPLPVTVYGWFVLGEFLSLSSGIGFILITIGIYLAKTGTGSDSQDKQSDSDQKNLVKIENA
ncbi:MAG: DMT family transporter [Dolichospermum sp.]|jgi:drug/metabolite transporter (DMT)-like permease|uniref:DMT family transporter n=1 Tax=Dolichospermum sp. FACHB-1091 TaxID=2692798 RepID=UPI001680A1FE|nr:DMT family transporter [Dolichospermum sp. FACHB-1091]MBD1211301.1 DMT family transporter [Dolichospermum circinale Clear-D4]MBD2442407.1 DMT family transporter [Dolichospermum sp. FACHB-1091]MCE2719286.1 DMT family transporter [Anabaena sp. 49628_E55]